MAKPNIYSSGTALGPFRIVKPLSDGGGMAVVYEAEVADKAHPAPNGNHVAIKVARGDYHADVYEKLLRRETALLQQLRHPGIVRICPPSFHGTVPQDRWYARTKEPPHNFYYAMELLEGDSLAKLIHSPREFRNFGVEWRVELLYQIALAIDYLHVRKQVHRDLKPENIMFRRKPNPQQIPDPVLIDFGLSEKRDMRQQEDSINAATVAYASPTWIKSSRAAAQRDENVNATALLPNPFAYDMWSLGVIAFEVFNERYAFGSVNVERVALEDRILALQFERMSSVVPPGIRNIIEMLLIPQDGKRLSVDRFLHELEANSGFVSPRL